MSAFSDYMEGLQADVPGRNVLADIAGAVDALRDEAEDVVEAAQAAQFPADLATALLGCVANLAWADDTGQDCYDDLAAAIDAVS